MALFLSTYTNKVDAKGRISVPSQFRGSLVTEESNGVVLYESFINDCIEGCGLDRIRKISDSIDVLDPFSEERDAFATAVLGGSFQLSIDSDGRIIVPGALLKKAKIKKQAVFVGKGPTFEIWEPNAFDKFMANAKKEARQNRKLLRLKND